MSPKLQCNQMDKTPISKTRVYLRLNKCPSNLEDKCDKVQFDFCSTTILNWPRK